MVVDLLAVAAQLSAAVFWPLMDLLEEEHNRTLPHAWALPTALVLSSCGWWETFTCEASWTRLGQWLYQVKAEMALGRRRLKEDGTLAQDMDGNTRTVRSHVTRHSTYMIVAPIKILVFFVAMFMLPWYSGVIANPSDLLDHFKASFGNHSYSVISVDSTEVVE